VHATEDATTGNSREVVGTLCMQCDIEASDLIIV